MVLLQTQDQLSQISPSTTVQDEVIPGFQTVSLVLEKLIFWSMKTVLAFSHFDMGFEVTTITELMLPITFYVVLICGQRSQPSALAIMKKSFVPVSALPLEPFIRCSMIHNRFLMSF